MNLAMSGIDVTEVARRKHNSFLVQGLCGRDVGAVGGKEHSLCESRVYEVCQERSAIPIGKRRATKMNEIDFDSSFYDILCQAAEKRFFRC